MSSMQDMSSLNMTKNVGNGFSAQQQDSKNINSSTEELNILVAVRCRGRNDREAKSKSPVVVTIPDSGGPNGENREVCLNTTDDIGIAAQLNAKTYSVDKVFGPNADQQQVFKDVADPLFLDFMKGYNCTVLVYGMTSTGKTYTMTGDEKLYNGELSSEAGIIPRVLFKLFETIEQENSDYLVKCSFVELYNEDLKDLLSESTSSFTSSSSSDINNNNRKLKIYDSSIRKVRSNTNQDSQIATRAVRSVSLSQPTLSSRMRNASRRMPTSTLKRSQSGSFQDLRSTTPLTNASSNGNTNNNNTNNNTNNNSNSNSGNPGFESLASPPPDNNSGIFIQNLQEFEIVNAKQGLKLLQRGLKLRQVAATNMNDFSSRSHSIFTITLYKNYNGELFRVSKMNLVDLAGSENISRSGAMNLRAKEAGSINQSLLTLGRVINSLADKSVHVPFRESKLTRLLQDSLGGNTKTALIATISPAKINSEETASTLEYATKAKNIKNKPQMGSILIKDILVKNIASELSKLKSDLYNTRSKEGIYMDCEHYDEVMRDMENYKTELQESSRVIDSLKQQNSLLLKDKEQHVEKIETQDKKVKELTSVIDYVYEKMDKQHKNEENMVDQAKQLVEAITLTQDSIDHYHEAQQNNKEELSSLLHGSLQVLQDAALHQISNLESQYERNLLVDKKLFDGLKKDFTQTITKISEDTNDWCSTIIDKVLRDHKSVNTTVQEKLDQLNTSISTHVMNTNSSLSVISDYCNDCNYYFNEKLFNSDNEKIINNQCEKTCNELEENSRQMVQNLQNMVEDYLVSNKHLVSQSLLNVTKEVKKSEKKQFEPTRKKLQDAIATINDCDSINIKFEEEYRDKFGDISSSLQKSSETNLDVEKYLSSELLNLQKTSTELMKNSPILSNIDHISTNFSNSTAIIATTLDSSRSANAITSSVRNEILEMVNQPDNEKQLGKEVLLNKILSDIECKQFKPVGSTGKTPLRPKGFQEMAKVDGGISANKTNGNELPSTMNTKKELAYVPSQATGSPTAPSTSKRTAASNLENEAPPQKRVNF